MNYCVVKLIKAYTYEREEFKSGNDNSTFNLF